MSIIIESTTDSNEAVLAALGKLESKPSEVEDKKSESSEKPDEKVEESETSKSDSDQSDEDTEDQDDSDNDESKDDSSKPKKKGGFKKRIERFQKQLSAREQELQYWKDKALSGAKSEQGSEAQKPEATIKSDDKPKESDFDSHSEFVEALTDWKIKQTEKEFAKKQLEVKAKTDFQKQVETFQAKVAEFSKTQDDFEDAIADVDDIQLTVGLQESILSSEIGPQVMYELSKNREELERINRLSPIAQAREIGKIEARLGEKNQKKPEAKVSKAPAPVSPVGTKGSLKTTKSPDEMTFQEYKKWREQNK